MALLLANYGGREGVTAEQGPCKVVNAYGISYRRKLWLISFKQNLVEEVVAGTTFRAAIFNSLSYTSVVTARCPRLSNSNHPNEYPSAQYSFNASPISIPISVAPRRSSGRLALSQGICAPINSVRGAVGLVLRICDVPVCRLVLRGLTVP